MYSEQDSEQIRTILKKEQDVDRIRTILDNMEDAVCATELNGELLYANPAAKKLFGLKVDGHTKIWAAIPFIEGNDDLIQMFIDSGIQRKKPIRSLVEYVNNEGQRFHLHVTLNCEPTNSGMILIVIHDLTSLIKVHSAFERYTSPEIADYVLSTPEGDKQGGQKRNVSIMMSDLRAFTAISTRLTSDELLTMLNHYFSIMSDTISRHGGTIIEFLGDGIFVVFGAPQEIADHAAAAVSCAIEMQNAMAEVNAWNRKQGYPDLEMGIGINSGPVVVGNIGSETKMKYGCIGETVNMAGRLESFTLGGEVCISENTRNMISEELIFNGKYSFMPKGGRKEIAYFSVCGIGRDCMLSNADSTIHWKKLPTSKELVFFTLDGKNVDPEPHAGTLDEISTDEKHGMLITGYQLLRLQNLMLRIDGLEAYAKVTETGERGFRISFTMKPDGFSALFS